MKKYSKEYFKRYPLPKEKLYVRYADIYRGLNENRFVTLVGMPQSGRSGFFMASKDQCKDVFEKDFDFEKNIFISVNALYKESSPDEYREYVVNSILKYLSFKDQDEIRAYILADKIDTALITVISKLREKALAESVKFILVIWGLDELVQLNPEHTTIFNEIFADLSYSDLDKLGIMFVVSPATLYSENCVKLHRYLHDFKVIFRVLDDDEAEYNCKRQEILKNIKVSDCKKYKDITGGHFGFYMHVFAGDFTDDQLEDLEYLQSSSELKGGIKLLTNAVDLNSGAQVNLAKDMGYVGNDGMFISKLMNGVINDTETISGLTPQQQVILDYLRENKDIVVTREDIAKYIWGDLWSVKYSNWALDKQISMIRKALKETDMTVKAVRGKGVKLVSIT